LLKDLHQHAPFGAADFNVKLHDIQLILKARFELALLPVTDIEVLHQLLYHLDILV